MRKMGKMMKIWEKFEDDKWVEIFGLRFLGFNMGRLIYGNE